MDIALVRVDNRLVHGQILEAWVPFTKSSYIIVVDDHVASDFFRETVIKMAVPREVEVIISSVEEFARNYTYRKGQGGKRAIVLFSDLADAMRAFQLGFSFDRLNIGNVYNEDCLKQCSPSVMLGEEDIRVVRVLLDAGVNLDVRRVPREKPIDLRKLMTMIGA
jgi:mannose/fructose/N-acetylgalactosamine-specific phosphotransferase system component IIB